MEIVEDYGMFDSLTFHEKISQIFESDNIILKEKLFDVKQDVDMIWTGFEHALQVYKQNPQQILDRYDDIGYHYKIDSSELTSDVCKEAHKVNPVEILIGFLNRAGSAYNPDVNRIFLAINSNAVRYLGKDGLDALPKAIDMYPSIGKEFEEDSIKGSIAHELSHWIDDSLHNKHITKELQKMKSSNKPKFSPTEWAFTTNHELDANIHAIASLKDKYGDTWDNMQFIDMINLKPSLVLLFKSLTKLSHSQYNNFIKRFFGRLVRENLLGNNMKPVPYQDLRYL
jgi:hypothetical protein